MKFTLDISTPLTEVIKMMKLMHKGALLSLGLGLSTLASAQVTTEPAEYQDPTTELKIIVDISKMDASLEHVANLQADAAAGLDLYIWTWSPAEHQDPHPLVNGTGSEPWKNSNDSLVMTKEAENIYSFTMIPTEFYEVDAQTVFDNDIEFLVKPKDGGGYGDPDRKSEDILIPVDPPVTVRNPAFLFPGRFKDDDLIMLYYDNTKETVPGMQNLADDDVWFFAQATLSDSTEVKIANNAYTVGNFPELQMTAYGDGIFKTYMVPRKFFNVPEGKSISTMTFFVMRRVFTGGDSRVGYDIVADLTCQ